MNTIPQESPPKRYVAIRVLRFLALAASWLALTIWTAWAAGALQFDLPPGWLRDIMTIAFLLGAVAVVVLARRWKRIAGVAVLCLIVTGWWLSISASNDRDWQPNVSVTAQADIDGDSITIHGVRNCDYRTELDYTPRFGTRTVNLSKLTRVDMFLCYWGSPWLAHPFVSFQFENADPICFSIETRMEQGESYSTIGGLYRQFELIYVVAEERDLVRVRTEFREGEDVYLFRIRVDAGRTRQIFLDYLKVLNEMHESPRFYNLLTSNCTTNIQTHSVATSRSVRPWDWRILLPGKLDELIDMRKGFVSELPLPELKPRCHVNPTANRVGDAKGFSRLIREGIPGFEDE
jgi:hypothetical protein